MLRLSRDLWYVCTVYLWEQMIRKCINNGKKKKKKKTKDEKKKKWMKVGDCFWWVLADRICVGTIHVRQAAHFFMWMLSGRCRWKAIQRYEFKWHIQCEWCMYLDRRAVRVAFYAWITQFVMASKIVFKRYRHALMPINSPDKIDLASAHDAHTILLFAISQ